MKLSFFTMPLHPPSRNYAETLKEDRETILLADRLGFAEAFIGEHVTDRAETVTSCLMFIASLAHDTRDIVLGSGTVNMSLNHPAIIAGQVAMIDNILEGRFLFGISPGALRSDAEALGILHQDRNEMFVESIDHVLAIWSTDPPYRLKGKYWNITTEESLIEEIGQGVIVGPYQKPHPPSWSPWSRPIRRADRGGGARLDLDLGQLPDARMGQDPLAQICRGVRAGGPRRRPRRLAGGEERLRRGR